VSDTCHCHPPFPHVDLSNTHSHLCAVSSIKHQEEKTKKEGEVQAAIFPLFRQGPAKKDAALDDPFAALLASQQNAKQVQQIVRDMSTSPIDISPPRNVDEARYSDSVKNLQVPFFFFSTNS